MEGWGRKVNRRCEYGRKAPRDATLPVSGRRLHARNVSGLKPPGKAGKRILS